MDQQVTTPESSTLLAFAGAVAIGGTNFLAVKFSNEELEPLFGAAVRFGAAAVLLLALTAALRLPLPRGRAAVGAAVYGLLGFGLAYAFLYYALDGLSPGTASVIVAAVPLMTLVLAVLHRQEQFSAKGLIGGLLAIVGIGILSIDAIGGDVKPVYFLASLAGVVVIAESAVVVKGFPRAHPLTTNAVGMVAGSILLILASLAFSESWTLPERGKTWLALTWLVVAGSIGLFALFLFVIARWTASATSYVVTLMPLVAVTLGILFADDEPSVELFAGGILVIAAVYVGALTREQQAPMVQPQPEAVRPPC